VEETRIARELTENKASLQQRIKHQQEEMGQYQRMQNSKEYVTSNYWHLLHLSCVQKQLLSKKSGKELVQFRGTCSVWFHE
jgi:hypothetical protein